MSRVFRQTIGFQRIRNRPISRIVLRDNATSVRELNDTSEAPPPPPPPTPHPYISLDIFKSAIFISGYGFRPHVSGESGMRIRSLEWKFFMKRFESGIVCTLNPDIILSGDLSKIEPSSLP